MVVMYLVGFPVTSLVLRDGSSVVDGELVLMSCARLRTQGAQAHAQGCVRIARIAQASAVISK